MHTYVGFSVDKHHGIPEMASAGVFGHSLRFGLMRETFSFQQNHISEMFQYLNR